MDRISFEDLPNQVSPTRIPELVSCADCSSEDCRIVRAFDTFLCVCCVDLRNAKASREYWDDLAFYAAAGERDAEMIAAERGWSSAAF